MGPENPKKKMAKANILWPVFNLKRPTLIYFPIPLHWRSLRRVFGTVNYSYQFMNSMDGGYSQINKEGKKLKYDDLPNNFTFG